MLRVESLEDRSYRIQFHDTKDVESRLPSSLFQLFNRRASHRVSPDPEEPVPVIISPSEGSQTPGVARMEDISATGIGIFVEGGVESELAAVAAVQLSFGLPPRNQPIEIAGEIRRRQLGSDGVSYGVQFDASTLENSPTEDEILTYVMRRQREELAVRVQTRD